MTLAPCSPSASASILRRIAWWVVLGLSSAGCAAGSQDSGERWRKREIKQLDREIERLEAERRRDPQPL